MKHRNKTAGKRLLAGLLAIMLGCTPLLGNVKVTRAASTDDNGIYYTWHRVKTIEQLEELFTDKAGTYRIDNEFDEYSSVPIMLVSRNPNNGYSYVLNNPGEKNEGAAKNELKSYGTSLYYHNSNWPSKVTYPVTLENDLAGLRSTGSTFTVISGDVRPFFLERKPYKQEYPKNRPLEYTYEIHTGQPGNPYAPSKNMLMIAASNDDDDPQYWCTKSWLEFRCFKQGSQVPLYEDNTHWAHAWNIDFAGDGCFKITTNYYGQRYEWSFGWLKYLVEMKATLSAYHTKNSSFWCAHAGIVAAHSSSSRDDYNHYSNWTDHKGYEKADSGYNDKLEIWYGVKGIEKSKLKILNGDSKFSSAEQAATGLVQPTELKTGKTVKAGETFTLPVLSFTHLPKGQTITIEPGGTLLLSRNAYLLNDGLIINRGTIIVQPGAAIGTFSHTYSKEDWDGPMIIGCDPGEVQKLWREPETVNLEGELVIRYGGKVSQHYVAQKRVDSAGVVYSHRTPEISEYKARGKNAGIFKFRAYEGYFPYVDLFSFTTADMIAELKAEGHKEIKPAS